MGRETSEAHSSPQSEKPVTVHRAALPSRFSLTLCAKPLSAWSRSHGKRIFDCCCVLLALPLLFPVLVVIAIAVRLTSSGPVFFLQKRMGRQGTPFTIIKFRTMVHVTDKAHHAVTTAGNQLFTPIGPFLRRYKFDELPQLLNVLWGNMSLVGPRPKLPERGPGRSYLSSGPPVSHWIIFYSIICVFTAIDIIALTHNTTKYGHLPYGHKN